MISIEVLLLVVIGISSAVLYSMYRYFNDMIDDIVNNYTHSRCSINAESFVDVLNETNKRLKDLEQNFIEKLGAHKTVCSWDIKETQRKLDILQNLTSTTDQLVKEPVDGMDRQVKEEIENIRITYNKTIKHHSDRMDKYNERLLEMHKIIDGIIKLSRKFNGPIERGSIRVVTPPLKERSKNAQQRPATTKTKSS